MKTLVNKHNPAIRITAPEIVLSADKEEYWIAGIPQRLRTYLAIDWTLVEEEPMDLEKEIDRLWDDFSDEISGPHNKFDIYARVAKHFYELGLKARKEG